MGSAEPSEEPQAGAEQNVPALKGTAPGLDEFPFARIGGWLAEGGIVPFVGAGASRIGLTPDCAPPDGQGLARELITEMAKKLPQDLETELAKVAQYYEHTVFDRATLYEFLHKRFEEGLRDVDPGQVALTLARAPRKEKPLFMITTNYDSSIERAFSKEGRPLCVITQNMRDVDKGASGVAVILPDGKILQGDSVEFQWLDPQRFPRDCAYLLKMHGSVHDAMPDELDDVIITEDDYVDFMVNAGGGANSPFFPPPSLTREYKRRPFLFLGYSLYDWNFRAFLRMLALRNALSRKEQRRHYAVQFKPNPIEVELWGHRNVRVFDGDLAAFCARVTAEWNGSSP
jgi:hypothetical protein